MGEEKITIFELEECNEEIEKKKNIIYWNLDKHDTARNEYLNLLSAFNLKMDDIKKMDWQQIPKVIQDQMLIMDGSQTEILGNLRELRELEKSCESKKM